jgi:exodeoxyribonuclease V alpha subunit
MLQRNLLYTAITRARELVVLVGTKRALGIAVRNARTAERHTALAERLRGALKGA